VANIIKTIPEPNKTVDVVRECGIVVIGGGPGGIGAAIAAARNGTDSNAALVCRRVCPCICQYTGRAAAQRQSPGAGYEPQTDSKALFGR